MSVLSRLTLWLSGEGSEPDDESDQSETGDCPRGGHHEWKDSTPRRLGSRSSPTARGAANNETSQSQRPN